MLSEETALFLMLLTLLTPSVTHSNNVPLIQEIVMYHHPLDLNLSLLMWRILNYNLVLNHKCNLTTILWIINKFLLTLLPIEFGHSDLDHAQKQQMQQQYTFILLSINIHTGPNLLFRCISACFTLY